MIYPGKRIVLTPGQYAVSSEKVVFRTLLGSCVAACLWDQATGISGMNHFLLAYRRHGNEASICRSEAGRYGVHAMELLINGMLKLGAQKKTIQAKVFGGASLFSSDPQDTFLSVGDVNCRFIVEFLKTDGIPLVARDLGGNVARVVHFASHDFSIHLRRIKRITRHHIAEKERTYWTRSLEAQATKAQEPELWL